MINTLNFCSEPPDSYTLRMTGEVMYYQRELLTITFHDIIRCIMP